MKARLLSGNLHSLHLNDTALPQGPRASAYIGVGGQVTADPSSVPAALRAAPVTPLSELQPPSLSAGAESAVLPAQGCCEAEFVNRDCMYSHSRRSPAYTLALFLPSGFSVCW